MADRSLVTNLPNETMSFFGFPFPEENQSFTTHGEVLDYLCSFADEHNLHPLISFGCPVETVRPAADASAVAAVTKPSGNSGVPSKEKASGARGNAAATADDAGASFGDAAAAPNGHSDNSDNDGPRRPDEKVGGTIGKWEVVYRRRSDTATDAAAADADATAITHVTEVFDAVCVCSGHYDAPSIPPAEGLGQFRGTSMHSKEYDRPDVEAFVGKRVLCVGSRSSGADIAREVSSVGESLICPPRFAQSEWCVPSNFCSRPSCSCRDLPHSKHQLWCIMHATLNFCFLCLSRWWWISCVRFLRRGSCGGNVSQNDSATATRDFRTR